MSKKRERDGASSSSPTLDKKEAALPPAHIEDKSKIQDPRFLSPTPYNKKRRRIIKKKKGN